MKTAIIIHGMPSKEEYFDPATPSPASFQWFPWLQKQLSLKSIYAQIPSMPVPYNPVYKDWKQLFEQFKVDENTILVGHSCGGGFLVRWLSENKVKVGSVVLAEPWLDVEGELKTGMFDFEIDKDLASRTERLTVLYGEDRTPDMELSVNKLKESIKGAHFIELPGKQNHFCNPTFPEILEFL